MEILGNRASTKAKLQKYDTMLEHQAGQKAGADAEAMEGCSLLACFSWLAQPAIL